jgi:hypothetical protein
MSHAYISLAYKLLSYDNEDFVVIYDGSNHMWFSITDTALILGYDKKVCCALLIDL